jgi:K+-transporting ATPase A subunit
MWVSQEVLGLHQGGQNRKHLRWPAGHGLRQWYQLLSQLGYTMRWMITVVLTSDNEIWGVIRLVQLKSLESKLTNRLAGLTTNFSYTSTALYVAVATGYSCTSANELIGRSSLKAEGTMSGAMP